MLTSSGQAATLIAVTNICEAGDHVVCSAKCYGGTSNLLTVTLRRFGLEVTLVDPDDPAEEIAKAFRTNTKAVFAETISNPAGVVLDIEKFVKLAHSHGVPPVSYTHLDVYKRQYKACEREGLRYEQTAVGEKYVCENMMANGYNLGGEQSCLLYTSRCV